MTRSIKGIPRRPIIAVIGDSDAKPEAIAAARDLGRRIARAGWHLLTGGGTGVMEGACLGFAEERSQNRDSVMSIGILPSADPAWANPYVDIPIVTGMGYARNAIIANTASALVAVGGRAGTLSEIAHAWQFGKPVVALVGAGGWADRLGGQAVDDRRADQVHPAATAEEAADLLRSRLVPRRD